MIEVTFVSGVVGKMSLFDKMSFEKLFKIALLMSNVGFLLKRIVSKAIFVFEQELFFV